MRKTIPIQLQLSPTTLDNIKEEFGESFVPLVIQLLEKFLEDSEMLVQISLDQSDNSLSLTPLTINKYSLFLDKGVKAVNGFIKNE